MSAYLPGTAQNQTFHCLIKQAKTSNFLFKNFTFNCVQNQVTNLTIYTIHKSKFFSLFMQLKISSINQQKQCN